MVSVEETAAVGIEIDGIRENGDDFWRTGRRAVRQKRAGEGEVEKRASERARRARKAVLSDGGDFALSWSR